MDTLSIGTSQNINIEQSIASIGERVAATLLDLLFIGCYYIVVLILSSFIHSNRIIMIFSLPPSLYSLISELAMNGQSWGKKIMKIKVVNTDGTSATFSGYFLRWITRLIEVLVTVGSLATITIILNRKGQRLGDIAANTAVIRLKDKSLRETIYTQLPDNYTVVYPEVSKLSAEDIYTIKEVLETLRTKKKTNQTITLAQKAHEAIEQKLDIKGNQATAPFLESILRDYNYLNRGF
ncbi:MAG: RDD family protein [Mariniphaga sp.]